ncbi:MAG: Hsp20/alpha crystallin family protein, partial [Planctomycetia bacterium]
GCNREPGGLEPESGKFPTPATRNRENRPRHHGPERHGGSERRLTLPTAIDAGGVEAALVNGVLTVTCPKAPECRPRKIDVRAG